MTDGVNLQKHQTNVLEVKNLKKIYGPRTVVKDVSLSIKSGEVVGLLGPNGAGKTTTMKAVQRLLYTSDKIYQIALDVGYKDCDYFINRFIAAKGCTPAKFRRQGGVLKN